VGYSGSVADILTDVRQGGSIIFTLVWPGENQPDRWLGKNIEVFIVPQT
jgi:glucoamylase